MKHLIKIIICLVLAFALGILATLVGLHHIAPGWVVYLASAIIGGIVGSLLHDVFHVKETK